MDRQMLDYLPPVLQKVRDFQCLMVLYQTVFESLWQKEGATERNFYLETADKPGLAHFERILGMAPQTGLSIEARRQSIAAQLRNIPPYCWRTLRNVLTDLTGEPEAITAALDGFTLTITIQPRWRWMEERVYHLLRQMIPANIALHLSLVFRRHRELGKYTHRQLGTHTHHQLRTEVDLT